MAFREDLNMKSGPHVHFDVQARLVQEGPPGCHLLFNPPGIRANDGKARPVKAARSPPTKWADDRKLRRYNGDPGRYGGVFHRNGPYHG